ncbi:hypothetical protein N656DRAFT_132465 [Canariomyces notabilis]|uniref:Uncharacterized protein n=1 Tax=Canariomyces notabilis TaxID=2074819 RepID=A0AAN6TCP4_9PEZI|nr:hypothetical protein N656DRAFT_132465 [Canariomyces arenarius]
MNNSGTEHPGWPRDLYKPIGMVELKEITDRLPRCTKCGQYLPSLSLYRSVELFPPPPDSAYARARHVWL